MEQAQAGLAVWPTWLPLAGEAQHRRGAQAQDGDSWAVEGAILVRLCWGQVWGNCRPGRSDQRHNYKRGESQAKGDQLMTMTRAPTPAQPQDRQQAGEARGDNPASQPPAAPECLPLAGSCSPTRGWTAGWCVSGGRPAGEGRS